MILEQPALRGKLMPNYIPRRSCLQQGFKKHEYELNENEHFFRCRRCGSLKTRSRGKISREDRVALWEKQNRSCAICKHPGSLNELNSDHDYKTERVRGLLCTRCNSGLGYFKDDPQLLLAAINYLQHPPNFS